MNKLIGWKLGHTDEECGLLKKGNVFDDPAVLVGEGIPNNMGPRAEND